ncbi:putative J domain-containing protein C2E1P5.03 [Labeo rohita]|uniref:J domain-containing protein C2E1P5.03 n=1 Tax=Labeo rohita TaxID=84645 RepID=A0ABQ8MIL1_LABRO|nr:putative J domain-containing protein C2E1P5.03 [Labeo rohita]
MSSSQWVVFLGTVIDSAQMQAWLAPECLLAIQQLVASFTLGTSRPLKVFQMMLSLMSQLRHINDLEMIVVFLGLKIFLPALKGHHVLIRCDNMTVVLFINCQGSLRSHFHNRMPKHLLLCPYFNLSSLRAVHLPGTLKRVHMLARGNVSSWNGDYPQVVGFREGRGGPLCLRRQLLLQLIFRKEQDVAHDWTSTRLYAFPLISLLPEVFRNQTWFRELIQLLSAAPWPIPLRKDLLYRVRGMIWHPQPELWSLHVRPLDGSPYSFRNEDPSSCDMSSILILSIYPFLSARAVRAPLRSPFDSLRPLTLKIAHLLVLALVNRFITLKVYVENSSHFRQSEQLFVFLEAALKDCQLQSSDYPIGQ